MIGIIYIPVKLYLSESAIKPFAVSDLWKLLIGQNPDVSLWFLYILFLIELISALLVNTFNFRSIWYGSFFLSVAIYWANLDIRTPKYLFFFLMGIWVRLKFEDSRKAGYEDPHPIAGEGDPLMELHYIVREAAALVKARLKHTI